MQVKEIFSNRHLLCMNILRTIMVYPSYFGLCRHFYFLLICLNSINATLLFCWYFAWECVRLLYLSMLFSFSRTIDYQCLQTPSSLRPVHFLGCKFSYSWVVRLVQGKAYARSLVLVGSVHFKDLLIFQTQVGPTTLCVCLMVNPHRVCSF